MYSQLKKIAPVYATPISLDTGRFTTKHYTTLKYNGHHYAGYSPEDKGEVTGLPRDINLVKEDNGVGDMRDVVKSLASFTVLGRAGTFSPTVRHHSYSGMNKEMLNSSGDLSFSAITKEFKEFNADLDVKESRVNHYVERFSDGGFYDNMTPLILSLYVKKYKLDIADKFTTIDKVFQFGADITNSMVGKDMKGVFAIMYKHISDNKLAGMSSDMTDYEQIIKTIMREVKMKYATSAAGDNKDKNVNRDSQLMIKVTIPCWEMYDYDDGHNVSGKSFGEVVGFISNLFLVPQGVRRYIQKEVNMLKGTKNLFPRENSMINNLASKDGFIDCASMSQREISILEWALEGNERSTPFLVDQTFRIISSGSHVVMYNNSHEVSEINNITTKEIDNTIKKLVLNHRTYQEHYNALVLLKDWVAQPATETLESHWWLSLKRTLIMPELGLKRAVFPQLMKGEAVCITSAASETFTETFDKGTTLYVASALLNTAYQWGEYLIRINAISTKQLLQLRRNHGTDEIHPTERTTMLQSAILGTAIAVCNYTRASTILTDDLDSQFSNVVKFGKIELDYLEDYGYTITGSAVIANAIVTPGATMMILGLASSLLKNTPLESKFTINPLHEMTYEGRSRRAAFFKDLWAMGVVARWNGYDLKYLTPVTFNKHRMFAANNVSVAMPPVLPKAVRVTDKYLVLGTYERDNSWGDDFEWARASYTSFNWNRLQVDLLEGNKYNSRPIYSESIGGVTPRKLQFVELDNIEVVTAVLSDFSVVNRSFLCERIIAGVPLPPEVEASRLLEVQEEEGNSAMEETP
uniref:Coat protein n=1 Tax=Erysiphales associated totivirus 4 TaxID=2719856 RepID=A0A6G9EMB7_9VIRU|nr:coat protein [Erysiphales associated totivirus 4]